VNCIKLKKSAMTRPLPTSPDAAANPGEFAIIDNEDGTLTLTILDPAGNPSPISPFAAGMTLTSDAPDVVEVSEQEEFTWRECAVAGKAHDEKKHGHHAHHARSAHHRGGTEATITAVITWTAGQPVPHVLQWKDTVITDQDGGARIERGPVTVKQ